MNIQIVMDWTDYLLIKIAPFILFPVIIIIVLWLCVDHYERKTRNAK